MKTTSWETRGLAGPGTVEGPAGLGVPGAEIIFRLRLAAPSRFSCGEATIRFRVVVLPSGSIGGVGGAS